MACATLKFPGDIVANICCGMPKSVHTVNWPFTGRRVALVISQPVLADGKSDHFRGGKESREIAHPAPRILFVHEVDLLGRCVAEGRLEAHPPGMTWADSLGQQTCAGPVGARRSASSTRLTGKKRKSR